MELLQLKYFCSAAETENFSVTAKEFMVPPSDISQSIHRLEKEIGTNLFNRTSNKVMLNENGVVFYHNASRALNLIEDAKSKIAGKYERAPEIRILAETNRGVVTNAVEIFQNKHIDTVFFIHQEINENINKYDIIVTDRNIVNKHFEKELLIDEEIMLAITKNNPLAAKDKIELYELEGQRFVASNTKNTLYKITHDICLGAGFAPDVVVQSDDPYYIRKYIEMGLGVSFIPSASWKGKFSDNVVLKKITDIKRQTFLYRNIQKYTDGIPDEFISVLKSECVLLQR